MNTQEILDSDVPGIMQAADWGWHGKFKWGDQKYSVQLRERRVQGVPRNLKAHGASFYLTDVAGDDAFSTVDTPNHPMGDDVPVKVYGAVLNAYLDAWMTENIDVIYFSAEPRHAKDAEQHERKELLYGALARRAQRQGGGYLYVNRGPSAEWILSKHEINADYWTNSLHEGLDAQPDNYVIKSI